eukprot:708539-Amphidinium_carterae.1
MAKVLRVFSNVLAVGGGPWPGGVARAPTGKVGAIFRSHFTQMTDFSTLRALVRSTIAASIARLFGLWLPNAFVFTLNWHCAVDQGACLDHDFG